MAITVVVTARTAAVALTDETTRFTTTGPFTLYGDGFGINDFEKAYLYRKGPSGSYHLHRGKSGDAYVAHRPNSIIVDSPGDYQIVKTTTAAAASVGYEEI